MKSQIPFGTMKTSAYLGWGIATALDQVAQNDWAAAELTMLLLMVAIEQSCLDGGRWTLAWLLTWLPEPPWHQISQAPSADPLRPFGRLAPPDWTAAAMAYVKDAASLIELRGKMKGKGKGGGGEGDGAPNPKEKPK